MGHRAAAALTETPPHAEIGGLDVPADALDRIETAGAPAEVVQGVAWDLVGIVRSGDGLRQALDELRGQNTDAATVVLSIAEAALRREESNRQYLMP